MKNKVLGLLLVIIPILLFGCLQFQGGKNDVIVGASCGTVTPGYNDECCASRNVDTPHIMCVGEWRYHATGNPSTECSWECKQEPQTNQTNNTDTSVPPGPDCFGHKLGESWESDCNTCGCKENGVVCTMMECENETVEPLVCSDEVRPCPDGSYVTRNPDNDCEFDYCPDLQYCDAEISCPDGKACYKFQDFAKPICWGGVDPCERCGTRECYILESYPEQIVCG